MTAYRLFNAVSRARTGIAIAALSEAAGLLLGIALVHEGNAFALAQRDGLVRNAQRSSIGASFGSGRRYEAALLDAAGNLFVTATTAVSAPAVVTGAGFAFYRGWVGGIVSVDGNHHSRLAALRSASYYVAAVILQSVPFVLAAGGGISIGLAMIGPYLGLKVRYAGGLIGPQSLRIPRDAVGDLLWIFSAAVPLILSASLFEFLAG